LLAVSCLPLAVSQEPRAKSQKLKAASGMEGAPSGASAFAFGDREYGTPAQPDPDAAKAPRGDAQKIR